MWRLCRAWTLSLCLHHRVHMKHTVSDRKFGCLCVRVCVVSVSVVYVRGADCASTASCRRKQFSQLLKRCPKLSRHRRMFLTHASALFYRAPQGFTLSAALFQTWMWDKTCSGAAPDWLRRQSRWILVRLNKSVTGSRLNQRLFTERRLCHMRVCGSKRLLLENPDWLFHRTPHKPQINQVNL